MKRQLKTLTLILAVAALVVALPPARATRATAAGTYTFTTLDVPGAARTYPMGRNAAGDIVGYYFDSAGVSHGFLMRAGKFATLDFPGSSVTSTQANAVGPNGDIVGIYSLASPAWGPAGNVHAFLLTSRGEWSTIDYPERGPGHLMEGGPFALLPDGTIVGCVHDGSPATAMYGTVQGPNGASRFDYPIAKPYSMFYDATPDGKTLAGLYVTDVVGPVNRVNQHGLILDNGKVIPFDVPGKYGTQAIGINAARQVVGVYGVQAGQAWSSRGYLADTGGSTNPSDWRFTMIDFPNAAQTIVRGVNDGGDLLGYYFDSAGKVHGFTALASAAAQASIPAPAIQPPSTGDAGLLALTDSAPSWGYAVIAAVAAASATLLLFVRRAASR